MYTTYKMAQMAGVDGQAGDKPERKKEKERDGEEKAVAPAVLVAATSVPTSKQVN